MKQITALSAVRGFLFWPSTTLTCLPACWNALSCFDICVGFPMLATSVCLFTYFSLPLEVELFTLWPRFQDVLYQIWSLFNVQQYLSMEQALQTVQTQLFPVRKLKNVFEGWNLCGSHICTEINENRWYISIHIIHFISHYAEKQLEKPFWTLSWHPILCAGIISTVQTETGHCSTS